jgi:hypothetical protein
MGRLSHRRAMFTITDAPLDDNPYAPFEAQPDTTPLADASAESAEADDTGTAQDASERAHQLLIDARRDAHRRTARRLGDHGKSRRWLFGAAAVSIAAIAVAATALVAHRQPRLDTTREKRPTARPSRPHDRTRPRRHRRHIPSLQTRTPVAPRAPMRTPLLPPQAQRPVAPERPVSPAPPAPALSPFRPLLPAAPGGEFIIGGP